MEEEVFRRWVMLKDYYEFLISEYKNFKDGCWRIVE